LKILYLAHRIPYPPNKGDKIRSFNEIKYLSQKNEVHLACLADNPADLRYTADLKAYCAEVHAERLMPSLARAKGALSMLRGRPFSVVYFHSKALQQVVNRWMDANQYDAVICFSSPMAEYLFRSPLMKERFSKSLAPCTLHLAPSLVMDFCDVDSDKWRQYAGEAAMPTKLIYWLESKLLLEYERNVNRRFDFSVFVSKPEADLFLKLDPGAMNLNVISNGVDHLYFSPRAERDASVAGLKPPALGSKTPVLLFTGAMDYHANINGVVWFCNEALPLIRRENPSVEFCIVGSNPAPEVKKLAENPGVKVTGFVEDIRPYYDSADVSVIPLRLARGIQNKILEAMAMAKPVVTTAKALEGIEATPGEHLLVADDPDGIVKAATSLLNDQEKRKRLGENARQFVVSRFDWSAHMKLLEDLLQAS